MIGLERPCGPSAILSLDSAPVPPTCFAASATLCLSLKRRVGVSQGFNSCDQTLRRTRWPSNRTASFTTSAGTSIRTERDNRLGACNSGYEMRS
jgi:hypothetical protein